MYTIVIKHNIIIIIVTVGLYDENVAASTAATSTH